MEDLSFILVLGVLIILVLAVCAFLISIKSVKDPVSSEAMKKASEQEGAKLAKATPSEQADLDWLNSL